MMVAKLLACWQGKFGRHWNGAFWMVVPHCLTWHIWQERNNQHFKDFEKVVPDLKVFFFKILLDWVAVLDFCSIFLVHGLMDTCTLGT